MNENKKPNNPSVYPSTWTEYVDCGVHDMKVNRHEKGVTLLDLFANSAMQGIISNPELMKKITDNKDIAHKSYSMALEMLKEREKYE